MWFIGWLSDMMAWIIGVDSIRNTAFLKTKNCCSALDLSIKAGFVISFHNVFLHHCIENLICWYFLTVGNLLYISSIFANGTVVSNCHYKSAFVQSIYGIKERSRWFVTLDTSYVHLYLFLDRLYYFFPDLYSMS